MHKNELRVPLLEFDFSCKLLTNMTLNKSVTEILSKLQKTNLEGWMGSYWSLGGSEGRVG